MQEPKRSDQFEPGTNVSSTAQLAQVRTLTGMSHFLLSKPKQQDLLTL